MTPLWLEDNRYLNILLLAEQKNGALRLAARVSPFRAAPSTTTPGQTRSTSYQITSAQLDAHNFLENLRKEAVLPFPLVMAGL